MMKLTEDDFIEAAKALHCDTAMIKTIAHVESGRMGGFNRDGSPVIRFEGHVFWRELKKAGMDPLTLQEGNEDILFRSWTNDFNGNQKTEYERLDRACKIDAVSALKSASYGMFQIMGFNHIACGYISVYDFYFGMGTGEKQQLMALVNYLKNTTFKGKSIAEFVRKKQFTLLARAYNGPDYEQNEYDTKLEFHYNLFNV